MMLFGKRAIAALGLAFLTSACASTGIGKVSRAEHLQLETAMKEHIQILASDEFGGRKPGTEGEKLTLGYLATEFSKAGFGPGSNDTTNPWLSPVMLETTRPKSERIELTFADRSVVLPADRIAANSELPRQFIENREILFVGRSDAQIPEDQFKGRIVLALEKDGRWPKTINLARKGAAAAIVVTDDEMAIAENRESNDESDPRLVGQDPHQVDPSLLIAVTGKAVAGAFGETAWKDLLSKAASDDFKPVVLQARATIEVVRDTRTFRTSNFVARLPGKVPNSGAILLMGHWDHLGMCRKKGAEDRICNGAVDNASGISLMIELARRLAASGPHDRDIYVLATTAEEMGMLGAKAFADNPPFALTDIVASFNFDTVAVAPNGKKVGFLGQGKTALDPVILDVLAKMNRELAPEDTVKQFLRRQDGWVLLDRGVPSVFISSNLGDMDVLNGFMHSDYHKPTDDTRHLVLGGAVDDLLLHEVLINRIASTRQYPGKAISGAMDTIEN